MTDNKQLNKAVKKIVDAAVEEHLAEIARPIYVIPSSTSKEDLEAQVCDLMKNGYTPTGGVSVHIFKLLEHGNMNEYTSYSQALYLPPPPIFIVKDEKISE